MIEVKNGNFKLTLINGVLIGTYTNEHCDGMYYPDCAKIKYGEIIIEPFEGNYDYAWFEKDDTAKNADLTIKATDGIYALEWTDKINHKLIFKGIGQREGNTLYGTYVSSN
jgi:hypothetical protein